MPRRAPDDNAPLGDDVLEAIAEAIPAAELPAQQRASRRGGVREPISDTQPADTETIRGEQVQWREAWPKVWVKVLKADEAADVQITLMRFEPGGRIPGHP